MTRVVADVPSTAEPRDLSPRAAGLGLLAVTLLAALLRFAFLDRPGVWADEAQTYGRVNGSFYQLLEVLRFDGFAPLHYELCWFLARHFTLEPWLLRFWPALAGTLTVPAVYFLARQFHLPAKTSLLAAAIACCSAYLNYYSRDAKMYAPLWLFVTLSMACFLWWLNSAKTWRSSSRVRWWCWIFCTTAAAGIHMPGLIVLAIQPLALLVHRGRSWLRSIAFALGVAVILAGPVYHYRTFNQWTERIAEVGWNASMIQWVADYNAGRGLPQLARFTATAYAVGWEWPDKPHEVEQVDDTVLSAFQWYTILVAGLLTAGLLPWRRLGGWLKRAVNAESRGAGVPPVYGAQPRDLRASGPNTGETPVPRRFEALGPSRLGRWAVAFLLAAWILVPAYATYVLSFDAPRAPWDLFPWIVSTGVWAWVVAGVVVLAALLELRRASDLLRLVGLVAGVFGLCVAVYYGVALHRAWEVKPTGLGWPLAEITAKSTKPAGMVWMPRYLGAIVPAIIVATAILLARLPIGLNLAAVAIVLLGNLGNHVAKLAIDPEPPVARQVADLWADETDRTSSVVFLQQGFATGFEPGTGSLTGPVGRYYLSLRLDVPFDPPTFRGNVRVDRVLPLRLSLRPRDIRDALVREPGARGAILWERSASERTIGSAWRSGGLRRAPTTLPDTDLLLPLLGPGWTRGRVETFRAYEHWTWRPLAQLRRTEYHRPPTTPALPTTPTHPTPPASPTTRAIPVPPPGTAATGGGPARAATRPAGAR